MKVAILLTGFAKNCDKTYPNLKKFLLDRYDCDIYISSWDKVQMSRPWSWDANRPHSSAEKFPLYRLDTDSIKLMYEEHLVDSCFTSYDNYYHNRFANIKLLDRYRDTFKVDKDAKDRGSFWVERLRDQWYIVKKGWGLIQNPEQYDIILRLRFDIDLKDIELHKSNFTIPHNFLNINYCDYFAYGNARYMKKYCHLFDNIKSMYVDYNVDISHADYMLKYYMENTGDKIKATLDDSIKYELIRN